MINMTGKHYRLWHTSTQSSKGEAVTLILRTPNRDARFTLWQPLINCLAEIFSWSTEQGKMKKKIEKMRKDIGIWD